MKNFIHRLQLLGTDSDASKGQRNAVQITNQVILWMLLLAVISIVIFAGLSLWFSSLVILGLCGLFAGCLWLNYKGYFSSAKLTFIIGLFAAMYLFRYVLGGEYLIDLMFLACISIPFVLSRNGEYYLHYIGIVLGLGALMLFNFTSLADQEALTDASEFLKIPVIALAFSIAYLALRQFKRTQFKYEENLHTRSITLEKIMERMMYKNAKIEEANEKLNIALKEREYLIKEVHHRVKNNMQIINSLMSLQEREIEDERLIKVFSDSKLRIQSMAMVHEIAYQESDYCGIDFKEYLDGLTNYLSNSIPHRGTRINFRIETNDICFNLNTAIPLGLLTMEILSNAIKYGFKDREQGEISVLIKALENERFEMRIGDNGVGFAQDIEFENTDSLGLSLISTLSAQIEGDVRLDKSLPGVNFIVNFGEIE